jgi:probable addiction module antidote protein
MKGRLFQPAFFVSIMPSKPVNSTSPSDRREITDHLNRAFDSDNLAMICQAVGEVLRLYNISEIAKLAGMQRTSLYRAFGGQQSPNLSTVLRVLTAMGFRLTVAQRRRKGRAVTAKHPRPPTRQTR